MAIRVSAMHDQVQRLHPNILASCQHVSIHLHSARRSAWRALQRYDKAVSDIQFEGASVDKMCHDQEQLIEWYWEY